ncbi:MAG: hypothetical protein HZB55_19650 [Deltaproteobacteria bacterium]|nr:hypothetical protein [Deltaproteobacteria bacterium]
MRIEVTTEGNHLVLPRGLRLRPTQQKLTVDIPDEAISPVDSPSRQQIDQILGPYALVRPARSAAEDKAIWHEHLEEKYLR